MNWVKKHKLPAIEAIQYTSQPCLKLEDLLQALYLSFNLAQNHQINLDLFKEISNKAVIMWIPLSEEEFKIAIFKYNKLSTPGPNRLL